MFLTVMVILTVVAMLLTVITEEEREKLALFHAFLAAVVMLTAVVEGRWTTAALAGVVVNVTMAVVIGNRLKNKVEVE